MPIQRLFTDYVVDDSTERTVVAEMYHCTGLPHNNPDASLLPPFPQKYQLHDRWPLAQCLRRRVVFRANPTECYSAAFFRSNNPFQWGNLPHSQIAGGPQKVKVPLFQRVLGPSAAFPQGVWQRVDKEAEIERPYVRRLRIKFVAGGEKTAETLADQIQLQLGARYTIGSTPYILDGFNLTRNPSNQIEIRYSFYTKGSMPALPVNVGGGIGVPLPPIAYLDEYHFNTAGTGSGPIVSVILADSLYRVGGPLP